MAKQLIIDHQYDRAAKKHLLNGVQAVLHCHHYATLFTELAFCTSSFGGTEKLVFAGEKAFGDWLKAYYSSNGIVGVQEKAATAVEYWKKMGMGLIRIHTNGAEHGSAEMEYSHLDEGWLKKYGGSEKPVNLFTQGFLAGVFSAMYDKPFGTYTVKEVSSLVLGDAVSRFDITMNNGGA